jgi:pimeloyl-ACP methyl ester carboxylesterase
LEYVRDLLSYWADGFDWRARERELNRYHHRIADVGGEPVHFVHHRAPTGGRAALILTHGWPSTFLEMLPLVDRLGGTYDLVVPSLPGYAYSPRPSHVGVDRAYVATQWHRLMQGLGYERYGAYGGDFGAGVATHMALIEPDRVIGIHLSTPELAPYSGPDSPPLTEDERAYLAHVERWDETERGYSAVQSTRPQSLGYGLTDSPSALAAWVLEKWRLWADTDGDLDARFGRDTLLTMLTVLWTTRSLASSLRDYYDNRWHGTAIGPDDFVRVPTAMAVFDHSFVREGEVPRSWYERLYAIRRWTVFPRGGHFAAAEEPDLLADDIRAFFDDLR